MNPTIFHNIDGNLLEVFLTDDPYYAQWINHDISIYRNQETDEITGIEISNLNKHLGPEKCEPIDPEKRKALEVAGWKFGDAEDFLNANPE